MLKFLTNLSQSYAQGKTNFQEIFKVPTSQKKISRRKFLNKLFLIAGTPLFISCAKKFEIFADGSKESLLEFSGINEEDIIESYKEGDYLPYQKAIANFYLANQETLPKLTNAFKLMTQENTKKVNAPELKKYIEEQFAELENYSKSLFNVFSKTVSANSNKDEAQLHLGVLFLSSMVYNNFISAFQKGDTSIKNEYKELYTKLRASLLQMARNETAELAKLQKAIGASIRTDKKLPSEVSAQINTVYTLIAQKRLLTQNNLGLDTNSVESLKKQIIASYKAVGNNANHLISKAKPDSGASASEFEDSAHYIKNLSTKILLLGNFVEPDQKLDASIALSESEIKFLANTLKGTLKKEINDYCQEIEDGVDKILSSPQPYREFSLLIPKVMELNLTFALLMKSYAPNDKAEITKITEKVLNTLSNSQAKLDKSAKQFKFKILATPHLINSRTEKIPELRKKILESIPMSIAKLSSISGEEIDYFINNHSIGYLAFFAGSNQLVAMKIYNYICQKNNWDAEELLYHRPDAASLVDKAFGRRHLYHANDNLIKKYPNRPVSLVIQSKTKQDAIILNSLDLHKEREKHPENLYLTYIVDDDREIFGDGESRKDGRIAYYEGGLLDHLAKKLGAKISSIFCLWHGSQTEGQLREPHSRSEDKYYRNFDENAMLNFKDSHMLDRSLEAFAKIIGSKELAKSKELDLVLYACLNGSNNPKTSTNLAKLFERSLQKSQAKLGGKHRTVKVHSFGNSFGGTTPELAEDCSLKQLETIYNSGPEYYRKTVLK